MPYKNKEDQAAAARRHYLKHKQKMKDRTAIYRKIARPRNKKFVDDYLASHPCVDCGEKDIDVLDFDHLGNKLCNVRYMANSCWSVEMIKKEIEKCEVRCANCHRRITRKRERGE